MTADLKMAKAAIENNTCVQCRIEHIYIMYPDWMDDTLVSYYPREYQMLTPAQVEDASAGMLSVDDLQKIIDDINARGW